MLLKWMFSASYALSRNSSPHCKTTAFGSMSVPQKFAATDHEDQVPIEWPLIARCAGSTLAMAASSA